MTGLVVRIFSAERLAGINDPLALFVLAELMDGAAGIDRRRLGPERRNRIIVTKLTENDDYWPQKCRASF
jgi:hypothetical protein